MVSKTAGDAREKGLGGSGMRRRRVVGLATESR
jgi:hypothetical protein